MPYTISKSLNDRVFFLPTYTLNALTSYAGKITVTTNVAPNSDSVIVLLHPTSPTLGAALYLLQLVSIELTNVAVLSFSSGALSPDTTV